MLLRFMHLSLMLIGCQVYNAASYNLAITPDLQHVTSHPSSATVMCNADVALTGCQFTWRSSFLDLGPVLDLSRGNQTVPQRIDQRNGVTGYNYTGRGLSHGECGITLDINDYKMWFITCRVKTGDGGWKYAWAEVYATNHGYLPHTRVPKEIVILPGGNLTFMLTSPEPLEKCRFVMEDLPGWTEFFLGDEVPRERTPPDQRYRYYGKGIKRGDCGIFLTNIQEPDSGLSSVYSQSLSPTDHIAHRHMVTIVARRPDTPVLSVVREGTIITATCKVENSRPVANITWLLGNVVIRQDTVDDSPGSPQDEWLWSWENATITQTVEIRPRAQDIGKQLKCKVTHVALLQPLMASTVISSG